MRCEGVPPPDETTEASLSSVTDASSSLSSCSYPKRPHEHDTNAANHHDLGSHEAVPNEASRDEAGAAWRRSRRVETGKPTKGADMQKRAETPKNEWWKSNRRTPLNGRARQVVSFPGRFETTWNRYALGASRGLGWPFAPERFWRNFIHSKALAMLHRAIRRLFRVEVSAPWPR